MSVDFIVGMIFFKIYSVDFIIALDISKLRPLISS
jgi:hypothetical protein